MKMISFKKAFEFLSEADACKVDGINYMIFGLVTEYDHDGTPYIAIVEHRGESTRSAHIYSSRNANVIVTSSGALDFVATSDLGYCYFITIVPLFEKRYTA